MKFNFNNKRVLITGSSKGIGYFIAKKFIESSATVTINSNNLNNLNIAKKKLNNSKLFIVKSDLSKDLNIKKLVKTSIGYMKGLDFLICNLGNGKSSKEIGTESYEDWMKSIKINLMSAIGVINYSKKYLKNSNSPSIICISSIAGLNTVKAPLNYSTSIFSNPEPGLPINFKLTALLKISLFSLIRLLIIIPSTNSILFNKSFSDHSKASITSHPHSIKESLKEL